MLQARLKTVLFALFVLPLGFNLGHAAGLLLAVIACLYFQINESLKLEEQQEQRPRLNRQQRVYAL